MGNRHTPADMQSAGSRVWGIGGNKRLQREDYDYVAGCWMLWHLVGGEDGVVLEASPQLPRLTWPCAGTCTMQDKDHVGNGWSLETCSCAPARLRYLFVG